ncbi:aspartic peptidase domain-containing protein [Trichoderma barbatum]
MAISSFLVLSLAVLAQARPKHAFEPEDVGNTITLPVIPASHSAARGADVKGELSQRSAADEEDKPFHILPFPYNGKRSVEPREEEDKPWHILPFPYNGKRDVEPREEEDKPFHILPFPYNGKRDVEPREEEDKPWHILPFPYPSKRDVESREEEDKPWHILPFPYPNKRDVESREEEDKPWHILPFPYPNKRAILEDDDGAAGGITLPVPQKRSEDEEDKPFHILPFPYNSKRAILEDDDGAAGGITLPVPQKRSEDKEDKPWHILPYPYPSKRTILKDDDGAAGGITLPVPQRRSEDEEDKPFHILPFNEKRKLPVEDSPSGTFTLPIIHAPRGELDKRAVEVQVENRSDVAYYAQLNIGTPPQTVYAQIDTGSFELWVNPDCSNVQTSDQRFCRAIGFYDPQSSSTSFITRDAAQLRYGIGSANVTYVRDSISLPGSATMKQVQFGVADSSVDEFSGILGIGAGDGINTNYPNFVDELAKQGVTRTKAFSLALGSKSEGEGVIIFGGVDTSKFQGKLAHLPIVPADDSPDGVARYWVDMNSISHSPPTGRGETFTETGMTVFIDSGSTLTLLPPQLVRDIAEGLGSTETDDNGFFIVDCALASQPGTIDFNFEGVTIAVPYSEMIRQVSTLPPHCYLGMMGSNTFALLGDTFMRSAYAVFDLTGDMVHLAPYANCGTSVKSITSTSSLNDLTGACNSDGSKSPSSSSSSSASKTASKTAAPPSSTVRPPSSDAQSATATPTGERASSPATTTAAKSSATGGPGAESAENGDKNAAGKRGVHGLALSMVLAAMGLLLI